MFWWYIFQNWGWSSPDLRFCVPWKCRKYLHTWQPNNFFIQFKTLSKYFALIFDKYPLCTRDPLSISKMLFVSNHDLLTLFLIYLFTASDWGESVAWVGDDPGAIGPPGGRRGDEESLCITTSHFISHHGVLVFTRRAGILYTTEEIRNSLWYFIMATNFQTSFFWQCSRIWTVSGLLFAWFARVITLLK